MRPHMLLDDILLFDHYKPLHMILHQAK